MPINQRFSCKIHIETALDDFVDTFAQAPELEIVDPSEQKPCFFCGQPADYRCWSEEEVDADSPDHHR